MIIIVIVLSVALGVIVSKYTSRIHVRKMKASLMFCPQVRFMSYSKRPFIVLIRIGNYVFEISTLPF